MRSSMVPTSAPRASTTWPPARVSAAASSATSALPAAGGLVARVFLALRLVAAARALHGVGLAAGTRRVLAPALALGHRGLLVFALRHGGHPFGLEQVGRAHV